MGPAIGVYDDVSTASRALIDLDRVAAFSGNRIQNIGLSAQLFPRFAEIQVTNYKPKGYILWQILSLTQAKLADVQVLSNASNWMKWKLNPSKYKDIMSDHYVEHGLVLCQVLEDNGYKSADFAALYT
jgi:hypothetical protein